MIQEIYSPPVQQNEAGSKDRKIQEFLARIKSRAAASEAKHPTLRQSPISDQNFTIQSNDQNTSTDASNHLSHTNTPQESDANSSIDEFEKINSNQPQSADLALERYSTENNASSTSSSQSKPVKGATRGQNYVKKTNQINQIDEKCLTNSQNLYRVLVHSRQKLAEPIGLVAAANFTEGVYNALMDKMCIRSVYRTQSVAWPHLLRGNSMVLINNAASGKTMTFLPAICSLVQNKCVERMVPDGIGPVAVILCVSSVKVVEVAGLCRKLLSGFRDVRVVEGFGEQNNKRIVPLLLNGCGIFVCTVPNLHRMLNLEIELNQKLFDKNRIEHLVIDDIDQIVVRFSSELYFVKKSICPRAPNGETDVQIVITARLWRPKWLGFCKLGMNPMLCIGAFIEAAVYSRSELQLKLIKSTQKIDQVLNILSERNYMENRTIVVCNKSEEVMALVHRLKEHSITPTYCHNKSTIAEIAAAQLWNLEAPPGQNAVFVCTDEKLFEVNIKSAQNIVHYSLPSDWTTFSFRFSAMSDYFENFIVNEKPTRAAPFSLVLLDENNNEQLPRLINFMLEHDVTGISEQIQLLAQDIRRGIEDKRRVQLVMFCPNVLLLGVCNNIACKFRHSLTYSDRSTADLPRNGRIKMEILNCNSPSHYSVRIVEHMSSGAKQWTHVSREYLIFSMKFQNHYVVADNHRAHIPVLMGGLCVLPPQICSDNSYHRCQIVKVDPKSKKVTVRLIDVGISLQAIHPDDLLHLAAEFSVFPSQAIDVRIANLLPYDYDGEWDKDSYDNVKRWLQKSYTENVYIEGTIVWSGCLNTIWIDTLRLSEKLPTNMEVFVLSIQRKLLDKKFGIVDDQCLKSLQRMAASCGIHDEPPVEVVEIHPSQVALTVENTPKIDSNRGRRFPSKLIGTPTSPKTSASSSRQSTPYELKTSKAVSDLNEVANDHWVQMQPNIFQGVHLSIFHTPWRIYFQILSPELYALYNSIDEFTSVTSNHQRIPGNMTIGMMCLAKDEAKGFAEYNRAKVLAIECYPEGGIMVTIFFVDLGASSVLPMNELLAIPEYLIEKEPFQAVLCSLVGIRPTNNDADWDHDLCDRMYIEILDQCENLQIRPLKDRSGPKSELCIWSYDCILVDMDNDDQTNTLNDMLVSSGLADYDLVDRHHLTVNRFPDINTKILDSDDDSDTPENWDNENYQRPQQLDAANESRNSVEDGVKIFDYNFTNDEVMEVLRSLCNLPSDPEQLFKMNTSESSEADIAEITNNQCEIDSDSEPEPIESLNQLESLELTDPEELYYRNIQIPALKRPAAVPNVKWQQSNTVIMLVIEAPDVRDYNLHVTTSSLQYSCAMNGVPQMVHMNLLGCVDTAETSHEIRGLSIYVRLIKTLRGPLFMWPRLLASDDLHRWLKYNPDAISLDETPKNQFKNHSKNMQASYLDSDDSDQEGTEQNFDLDNADPLSTEFD